MTRGSTRWATAAPPPPTTARAPAGTSLAACLALSLLAPALGLAAGCADPAGNDPNVPDVPAPEGGLGGAAVGCGQLPQPACAQVPSYASEVAPLVRRTCLECHASGGVASNLDLSTYADVTRDLTTVETQVLECYMPPPDASADASLTAAQRTEILQWLQCGFPDN